MALPPVPAFGQGDYDWQQMVKGYARGAFLAARDNTPVRMLLLVNNLVAAYPNHNHILNQDMQTMARYVERQFSM
jgi:hypothetical protein